MNDEVNELDLVDYDSYVDEGDNHSSPLDGEINTEPMDIPDPEDEKEEEVDTNLEEEDDLLTAYLKFKGIKDPKAIKQLDDDGNIQEIDFNQLSREEQLNILNSSDLDNNYGLEPEETEFINLLRDNNITVENYLDYIRKKAIEDFISANNEPKYEVDNLSDEELYLLDLQYNFKDISEEEAKQYLDYEKSNEVLWNKKMQVLRDNYKEKERAKLEEEQLLENEKIKESQEAFQNQMYEAINSLDNIESFDLEQEDKEKIAEFIFGTDATGTNYMERALRDPENIAKIAWFLLDGGDSIKALNEYWTGIVKEHSQNKYKEGYQDALNGKKSKVTVKNNSSKTNKTKTNNFIRLSDMSEIDLD